MTDRTEAMDALIAQDADLIDVEPVAWMYRPVRPAKGGFAEQPFVQFNRANMNPRYWTETPLYTREQAERETVEKLVDWLRSSGSRFDAILADELEEGAWKP